MVWLDLQGPWTSQARVQRGLCLGKKEFLNIIVVDTHGSVWRTAVGSQFFLRQAGQIEYIGGADKCPNKDSCKGCSHCYTKRKVSFTEGGCRTLVITVDQS
jgi:hypothetical protein